MNTRHPSATRAPRQACFTPFHLLYVVLLALLAGLQSANAGNYYVATTGVDTNSGTLASPYKTITKGISVLNPGDTLYVRAGTYVELVNITRSGNASALIKVMAYPGESPVVDGKNTIPSYRYDALVKLSGQYIEVNGFEVKYSHGIGVQTFNKHNIVRNCNIHHSYDNGFHMGSDYNLAEDNRVWQTNQAVFYIGESGWGAALAVSRDPGDLQGTVAGFAEHSVARRNIIYQNYGEGLNTHESDDILLEDNIVYDNSSVNLYVSNATNVIVRRNIVYTTAYSDGFVWGNTGSTPWIYPCNNSAANAGNRCKGAGVGINLSTENNRRALSDIQIYNNVVLGTSIPIGTWFWTSNDAPASATNVLIANNTFVNGVAGRSSGEANFATGTYTGSRFTNNITLQENAALPITIAGTLSGMTFDHNLWSKAPVSAMSSATDVIGNPQLQKTGSTAAGALTGNYFKLAATSPAKFRGSPVSRLLDDFFQSARCTTPDIGAHESDAGAASTIPAPLPVPSTPNLALSKPAVASSVETTGVEAAKAFDGSASSRWSSIASDAPQWLYVDLGANYNVNRVKLVWEAAYSKAYLLQVSLDKTNWTTIYSTAAGTGGTKDHTGLSGVGRYVRMYGQTRATVWGHSLWEMEVYGTAASTTGSVNLALNKPATASSLQDNNATYAASKAFDGNTTSTRWSSKFADPQWLQVDLGARYNIGRVKLVWEAAYSASYKIEVSNDAVTWTSIYSTTSGKGGSVDLTSITGVGRYVRMYGNSRGTTWGHSLYEMEIYGSAWK